MKDKDLKDFINQRLEVYSLKLVKLKGKRSRLKYDLNGEVNHYLDEDLEEDLELTDLEIDETESLIKIFTYYRDSKLKSLVK